MTIWSNQVPACIATYNILESDRLLNQFDVFHLPFAEAGNVKLVSLPYYAKYGMSAYDVKGRIAQMSRYFFKYLVENYTDRRHNPSFSIEKAWAEFEMHFGNPKSTVADLAAAADTILIFNGERP